MAACELDAKLENHYATMDPLHLKIYITFLKIEGENTSFLLTSNIYGGPLSLCPSPSGRLKNLKDADKLLSFSLCLSVRGMLVTCKLDCACAVRWVIQCFESCST